MKREDCFFIDKLTDCIEDVKTGKKIDTIQEVVSKKESRAILKKDGWLFNWRVEYDEPDRQVFKLIIPDDPIIQGLVSLEPKDGYIEMHLLESAPHNMGQKRKYAGVAGNLVAFVCKRSFEAGFDGHIAFTAKTQLIRHYKDTLGAEVIYRRRL